MNYSEILQQQNPSNYDLRYIVRFVSDEAIRNKAWELLKKEQGITETPNEKELIKKIADSVVNRPGSLKMDSWHCGTSRCLAGWACVIDETAKKIEKQSNTETAGRIVLPSYQHLFFSDNETVLNILKEIAGNN